MKRTFGLLFGTALLGALMASGITHEVPLGRVDGNVIMRDHGRPLPDAAVTLTMIGQPESEKLRPRFALTKRDGSFSLRNVPAGYYEVEVASRNHRLPRTIIEVEEGKPTPIELKLDPGDRYLSLYASQRVFAPGEKPRVEMHGFLAEDSVQVEVRKLNAQEVAERGGLQSTLSPLANPDKLDLAAMQGVVTEEKTTDFALVKKDVEGAFIDTVPLEGLSEGFYWVRVRGGSKKADTVVNVSRLALVTKNSSKSLLAYTTDLVTGKPIRNVPIRIQRKSGLVELGRTGSDGTLEVGLPPRSDSDSTVLLATHGQSEAIVGFWQGESEDSPVKIFGYTDRPVYRPGDLIQFKSFVRKRNGDDYSLPGRSSMQVELRDPHNEVVGKMSTTTNERGAFSGSFTTSKESEPGIYQITAKGAGGELDDLYITLASYRKPEYEIGVVATKPNFVLGDKASATITCQYYFGGPVVGAKVTGVVLRSPVWEWENEEGETEESGDYGSGQYFSEFEGTTDEAGRLVIDFPTRAEGDPEQFETDFIYSVSASVADQGGKYFSGEGKVRVNRGEIGLNLELDRFILIPGEAVEGSIKTFDAIDREKPAAGRDVTVEYGREEWTRRSSIFIPMGRFTTQTDARGIARIRIPSGNKGSLLIKATTRDSGNRRVGASAYAYIEGGEGTSARNQGSLSLTLDKRRYGVGETARAMIETDLPGGSALVTVQNNEVLQKFVIPLETTNTMFDLPVTERETPNAFVNVVYIKDKQAFEANKSLTVQREDRDLKVSVTPDSPSAKPGDLVRFTVQTTDAKGNPVPADVSLSVVDESIYTIKEDSTDLIAKLYPRRYNEVQTTTSFPDVYLDGGDKAEANIPLRSQFRDTASWNPNIWTGTEGTAKVEVRLPDNLTRWRATAIALSDNSAAGKGKSSIRASKPLMVRISPPGYLVVADRQQVAVAVTNDTGTDQTVRLRLDSTVVELEGNRDRSIQIAAGKSEAVTVLVSSKTSGGAKISARAWTVSGESDGVEMTFPVHVLGRTSLKTQAGSLRETARFSFQEGKNMSEQDGFLRLTLSPSLTSSLVSSLDQLVDFPYGCVEQTMSRFLPAILVGNLLEEKGIDNPKLRTKIPLIVRDGYARLGRMQQGQGGWGWWEYGDADVFMTALVLDGIDRAQRAGYPVQNVLLPRALDWGVARLADTSKPIPDRDRLYLAYSLMRHGRAEAKKGIGRISLEKADAVTLATAALAANEAGMTTLRDRALDRLKKTATGSAGLATWASHEGAWGEEPNALALTAFATLRPNDPIVPNIVRAMMSRRQGRGWLSTRDTSYSLIGMTSFLKRAQEIDAPTEVAVWVNGRERTRATLTRAGGDVTITIPKSELPKGSLNVELRKVAGGEVYYAAELSQFQVRNIAPERSEGGFRIERKYFGLEPRRLEDGTTRLLPTLKPISKIKAGELVRVELTIYSDFPREFMLIEDPVPSNCRIMEREEVEPYETWGNWWSRTVIRDDRIAFFSRNLMEGKNTLSYTMRAEGPGVATALPARIENMYDPGQRASTGLDLLEVQK